MIGRLKDFVAKGRPAGGVRVNLKDPQVVVLCERIEIADNKRLLALCVTRNRKLLQIRSKGISICPLATHNATGKDANEKK